MAWKEPPRVLKKDEVVAFKDNPEIKRRIPWPGGVVECDQHPRGKSVKVRVADGDVFEIRRCYLVAELDI